MLYKSRRTYDVTVNCRGRIYPSPFLCEFHWHFVGEGFPLPLFILKIQRCPLDTQPNKKGIEDSIPFNIFLWVCAVVRDRKNFSEVSNFAAGLPEGVRQNKQHYTSLLLFAKVLCVSLFLLSKSKTFFDFVLLAKMLCEYKGKVGEKSEVLAIRQNEQRALL